MAEIRKLVVIGAGIMGSGIAQVAAQAGAEPETAALFADGARGRLHAGAGLMGREPLRGGFRPPAGIFLARKRTETV